MKYLIYSEKAKSEKDFKTIFQNHWNGSLIAAKNIKIDKKDKGLAIVNIDDAKLKTTVTGDLGKSQGPKDNPIFRQNFMNAINTDCVILQDQNNNLTLIGPNFRVNQLVIQIA